MLDGNKIRRLREAKKLSQFDLSLEINLSREIISQIENNKAHSINTGKNVSLDTALRLASYFGVKVDDILLTRQTDYYR